MVLDGVSTHQEIIPGLPNDLALRCLTRVSHGYHGNLECVSKRWREVMRSEHYSHVKASEGLCGNWLFVLTEDQRNVQWNAYDPEADRWHPLPMMPIVDPENGHYGFSCACLCKRFLVLGGYYPLPAKYGLIHHANATNNVVLFDPFRKQWDTVASMRMARYDFACAVVCDMVYVAGGCSPWIPEGLDAAEVYDPLNDRWEDLPPMPVSLVDCFGISHGGRFHVIGRKENMFHDTHVIFNPSDRIWQIMDDIWPFYRLMRHNTTVLGDCIYTIQQEDSTTIKIVDAHQRDWYTLGAPPPMVLPEHNQALQPFGCGFVAFRRGLYIVGGKSIKYNSNGLVFDVMKLSSISFSNPKKSPLAWRDARPMFGSRGAVVGCASLEE